MRLLDRPFPSLIVARQEARLLLRDPAPIVVLVAMPLLVTAFLKPVFQSVLAAEGYRTANGAEHAVPAMASMFAFFLVAYVGFAFFREHAWGTWDRLICSPLSRTQLLVGKLLPLFLLGMCQQLALFGIGTVVLGLRVRGSTLALLAVAISLTLAIVALGFALFSFCRTVQQLSATSYLNTLVLGGVGGALAPVSTLPHWLQLISPFTPVYWAVRGFRSVILDGATLSGVGMPVLVLMAFAAFFAVAARLRFRFEEPKSAWA